MNELIVPFVVASIGVVTLVAVLIALWRAGARRFQRRSLVLMCPGTGRPADILALQDRQSGRFTQIVSCSELPPRKRCRQSCLMLANCARLYDADPSRCDAADREATS